MYPSPRPTHIFFPSENQFLTPKSKKKSVFDPIIENQLFGQQSKKSKFFGKIDFFCSGNRFSPQKNRFFNWIDFLAKNRKNRFFGQKNRKTGNFSKKKSNKRIDFSLQKSIFDRKVKKHWKNFGKKKWGKSIFLIRIWFLTLKWKKKCRLLTP